MNWREAIVCALCGVVVVGPLLDSGHATHTHASGPIALPPALARHEPHTPSSTELVFEMDERPAAYVGGSSSGNVVVTPGTAYLTLTTFAPPVSVSSTS